MVLVMRTTGVSESVTIPCQNIDTFSAEIDWGDGSAPSNITTYNDPDLTHTYAVAGDYEIRISGTFPNIYFNNTGDKLKLIKVVQLGKVGWLSLEGAFYGASNMTAFACGNCNTSKVTNMNNMMRGWSSMTAPPDLSSFDTSNVTDMQYMMQGWSSMTTPPDLTSFDTSKVTSMYNMMQGWSSMTAPPDLSSFDTSKVTNMHNMMHGWSSMTTPPDLTSFDTSKVISMESMMYGWSSMTEPPNLAGFDTSSVTRMGSMMQGWSSMTEPPNLAGFDTSSVARMGSMMYGWSSMTAPPDLTSFDTSNVTDMSYMMYGWRDMIEVGDIGISAFNISSCTTLLGFATQLKISTVAYDEILIAWAAQAPNIKYNVPFSGGNSKYTAGGAAEAARSLLVNTYGWAITDGGAA